MDTGNIQKNQRLLCDKFGLDWVESPMHMKIGISENVRSGLLPINGFRHPPQGDTTGWYIYAGEVQSIDPNFYKPLCIEHLGDWCPGITKYLGIPPGYRFLSNLGSYEDIWKDPKLFEI